LARRARIRRALDSAIDENVLSRVAIRHGVAGLVVEGLRAAGASVPERLAQTARRRGLAAVRQAGEALRLQQRLGDAGIPALFLKGAPLARRAYGTLGLRSAFDIDLVVAPAAIEPAWRVLDEMGYARTIPRRPLSGAALRMFRWAAKDSLHRQRERNLVVELHWRLSDDLADPEPPPEECWQQVEVAPGQALATLGDEDLFVYLSVHGAAHLWARLKWLADIGALVAASGDGGACLWEAACRAGAGRPAASGLVLAHQLLGTPLPPGFVAPPSLRLRLLNRLALGVLTAGGGARDLADTPYRGWAEFAAKLLVAPRPRNALAVLRRMLISAGDVGEVALPPPLFLLYPVLRIPLLIRRRLRRAQVSASRSRSAAS
jgi:hypothetical protein